MKPKHNLTRRQFLKTAAAISAGAALGAASTPVTAAPTPWRDRKGVVALQQPTTLVHWSWLAASDAEVWHKVIDNFNKANKDLQIKIEDIPEDQYNTKIVGAVAAGQGPDFGWGTGGLRAQWVHDKVVVALDDLAKKGGLDLTDFTDQSLKASRYPQGNNQLFMIPMDAMSLQMEVNLDHVKEAGLDATKPPQTGDELLTWAKAMTKIEGGKVTRSGFLTTGSGVAPTVTWGIVSAQMGFQRASDDLKKAAINPDAGKAAMQWILDLFDKHKVSTRDIADRYKAFGTGEGSMFWTGPWTLNGYVQQGLNFETVPMPKIGKDLATYYELGGMEFYTQKDTGRYEASMKAVKWLSDNSFLWTTIGRGAATRKTILGRDDYKTAGHPWKVRGAFIDGMSFATLAPVPVLAGDDFNIYNGGNFLATTLSAVWAGDKTIDQAMQELTDKWQADLDAG